MNFKGICVSFLLLASFVCYADVSLDMTVKDRITVLSIFPRETNLVEQTYIRDISDKVVITQEEIKAVEFQYDDELKTYKWNAEKDKPKKIKFTDVERDFILDIIRKLDQEKKITIDIYQLYEKFNEAK